MRKQTCFHANAVARRRAMVGGAAAWGNGAGGTKQRKTEGEEGISIYTLRESILEPFFPLFPFLTHSRRQENTGECVALA